jgi:nucleotide-binding universal stress UspA family protein
MKMFKNVLVGVDGRPNGRDAIALAQQLTDPDGKITLANVHAGKLHPLAIAPEVLEGERQASDELLERERADADVTAELVSIAASNPGRGLHEHAEDQGADLLVVGSTSRGPLGRAMLGDDTRGALNGAPCAVAIASAHYSEKPVPIARIGVAYNESPESKLALAVARKLAETTSAAIRVLEVVSIPTVAYTGVIAPAIGENIDEMLHEANGRLKGLQGVDAEAVYGLTGEELAEFGDGVDLLVAGSRGYGPVKRLVLGSTSDYLERHARCSLLVLPRGASVPASAGGGERSADAEVSVTNA